MKTNTDLRQSEAFKGFDSQYKLILLGPASSGKTSLLLRFVDEVYKTAGELPTIGVDLKSVTL